MANGQSEIVAFLSQPQAYGLAAGEIERHTTHGSIVFLVGEDAYKLKRAVKYSYMDYSTAERRKVMCEAELSVNRRLALELYLDVLPIIRDKCGALHIGLASECDGAVDWLVHMRRFADGTLYELVKRGVVPTISFIRRLAERIAEFHGAAEVRTGYGGARGIARVIAENSEALAAVAGRPFDRDKIGQLEALARTALDGSRTFLDARRSGGYVRRCHGDMHLNNICVSGDRPVLFDAIEFSEDFACIDVLYDLAFLLMDLDRCGLRIQSNVLLNRYLELTGDYAGLAVLPLFLSCRAAMRAHVTVTAANLEKTGMTTVQAREATDLLDRAVVYLEPGFSRLIAIGGVSGTGKSTLAAGIAAQIGRAPGAIIIRSDVIRKHLWGVDEMSRLPQEAYDAEITRRVYARALEMAAIVLDGGYSCIVDAVFGSAEQRNEIAVLAHSKNVSFHGLWLDAPESVLETRIAARNRDASDATVEVLRAQLAQIIRPSDWTAIDAAGTADEIRACAVAALTPSS